MFKLWIQSSCAIKKQWTRFERNRSAGYYPFYYNFSKYFSKIFQKNLFCNLFFKNFLQKLFSKTIFSKDFSKHFSKISKNFSKLFSQIFPKILLKKQLHVTDAVLYGTPLPLPIPATYASSCIQPCFPDTIIITLCHLSADYRPKWSSRGL